MINFKSILKQLIHRISIEMQCLLEILSPSKLSRLAGYPASKFNQVNFSIKEKYIKSEKEYWNRKK